MVWTQISLRLSVLLLAGCASLPPQVCQDMKPAAVKYINDPQMVKWCADHGAKTNSWGGCTTCLDYKTYRVCEIRMNGQINEVDPEALAHEVGHVFGCVHAL